MITSLAYVNVTPCHNVQSHLVNHDISNFIDTNTNNNGLLGIGDGDTLAAANAQEFPQKFVFCVCVQFFLLGTGHDGILAAANAQEHLQTEVRSIAPTHGTGSFFGR